jgi:hypothetical protein
MYPVLVYPVLRSLDFWAYSNIWFLRCSQRPMRCAWGAGLRLNILLVSILVADVWLGIKLSFKSNLYF